MKITILFVATTLVAISAFAQTPPPDTISRPTTPSATTTNQTGTAGTFTNSSGATYSADQLSGQLQNLRGIVDQTLPVLSAFTETVSNANANQSVTGGLSGLLSGALHRNSTATNTASSGQSGFRLTNLLSSIDRLLHTNSPSAPLSNDPNTIRELETLQNQLQSVATTLQSLNIATAFTNTPAPTPLLTPTGR